MKAIKILYSISIIIIILSFIRCSKFLDEKPNKTLKIPSTVEDLQSMLDDSYYLNSMMPTYALASCDDYFITEGFYNSQRESVRNAYIWQNYNYTSFPNDWLYMYNIVNVSNNILEAAAQIEETVLNKNRLGNIIGSALFLRSLALYNGMGIYCKAYNPATASADPGMVLKLTSSVDEKSQRASMESTCRLVLDDLITAVNILPDLPEHKIRPSKAAAATLLARTYIYMQKFDSAKIFAASALTFQHTLMDYNDFNVSSALPFSIFNDEVIFHAYVTNPEYSCVSLSNARIDTTLYQMFEEDDLRKTAFFESTSTGYRFKGIYNNSRTQIYQGITTDELYLMRAEANARLNNIDEAAEDINYLLQHRWKKDTFTPLQFTEASEALEIILNERRKELIYRGLRWMDIKRLNQEGAGINLKRNIGSEFYELKAGDPYFALPLPEELIQVSGIEQNKY